jgi:hypothetical protein
MAKAPIKLEGFIGSMKVCNDLIIGTRANTNAISDVYSDMIYVGIDGIKNPLEMKQDDEGFGEILCPITDFSAEQQAIDKKYGKPSKEWIEPAMLHNRYNA